MKSFWHVVSLSMKMWANAHRFNNARYHTTNTMREALRKEFDSFKKNGYKVISLEKLVTALHAKETTCKG